MSYCSATGVWYGKAVDGMKFFRRSSAGSIFISLAALLTMLSTT